MKFTIKEQREEDTIELWLEKEEDKIVLKGKDKNGEKRYIMEFKDGKFQRAISTDLSELKTDDDGRIIETDKL